VILLELEGQVSMVTVKQSGFYSNTLNEIYAYHDLSVFKMMKWWLVKYQNNFVHGQNSFCKYGFIKMITTLEWKKLLTSNNILFHGVRPFLWCQQLIAWVMPKANMKEFWTQK